MPGSIEMPNIKLIPLDKIDIDKRYQRVLKESFVAGIADDFKTSRCGVLSVTNGRGDRYSAFDGQHRLAALRLLGVTEWYCDVYESPPKEAAVDFVGIQTGRRAVTQLERHKAKKFAGDKQALAVEALVRDAGFSIGNNKVFGELECVHTLNECHRIYGPAAMKEALAVIDEAWGREDRLARKAPMVRGMTLLLAKYDKSQVDRKILVEKLRSMGDVGKITRGAASEARLSARGTTAWMLVAYQLLDAYNVRRRHLTEEELAAGKRPTRISPQNLGRGA